ncbi:hypothetical protein DICPUDRAFT_75034 [Dictyostelium purpureum]|uniref:Uncharacterized protein n=1 Tax=Dictyostelium purpureum TaxID=5786 RepID=F0Z9G0_DICPU|nr:uncharacterized protein DICPUDRAFT_75034 [Dictyostelium purpureum]EGC39405.1 hypothetical protein DICPUDRAFT_75034 [Dictyostelium purpureum]|eukprot:XP_003284079.1 hypothetical protein DICPUDRAFT_75034 [Dictyostelium purpureum]
MEFISSTIVPSITFSPFESDDKPSNIFGFNNSLSSSFLHLSIPLDSPQESEFCSTHVLSNSSYYRNYDFIDDNIDQDETINKNNFDDEYSNSQLQYNFIKQQTKEICELDINSRYAIIIEDDEDEDYNSKLEADTYLDYYININ